MVNAFEYQPSVDSATIINMAKDPIDLTNCRIGRLMIIGKSYLIQGKYHRIRYYKTECDCGTIKPIKYVSLVGKNPTLSCGCLAVEILVKRSTIHGYKKHSLYGTWKNMWNRCNNPENEDYSAYGGRGIKICKRWNNIKNFISDMGERPKGLTLDRIDNNGNYCQKNCKWSTNTEQARNRRSNVLLTLNGVTKHATDWAKEYGITQRMINHRLKIGWSIEDVITKPSMSKR